MFFITHFHSALPLCLLYLLRSLALHLLCSLSAIHSRPDLKQTGSINSRLSAWKELLLN